MKTTMLTKAMMAVLFAMTSVLTLNAAKPVKITNEEVENGRVSAKVVYEQEGTFLTPEYRFEFRYNDKGQIIEKKSMKWNGTTWIIIIVWKLRTQTQKRILIILCGIKIKKRLSLRRNMYIR